MPGVVIQQAHLGLLFQRRDFRAHPAQFPFIVPLHHLRSAVTKNIQNMASVDSLKRDFVPAWKKFFGNRDAA
jgi:hypothetical protein